MLEMKITITAPDLSAAINNLATALANGKTAPVEKATTPVASAPVAQPATPTAPVNPSGTSPAGGECKGRSICAVC